MRPGLVIGIGSLLTAFVIGAIHQAFTGDAGVLQLAVRGAVFACVIALLMLMRLGPPLSWRLRLTLRGRARSS